MKKVSIPLLALAISGCTTPPLTLPNTQADYSVPSRYLAPETRLSPPPCSVTNPARDEDSSLSDLIDDATAKSYSRGCTYAGYIDSAKNFGAVSDQITLGLLAGTGIGALTNSHSDLVKSLGALTGLSLGTKLYVNPKAQMTTYGKAAITAQCLGDTLSDLHIIVKGNESLFSNITKLEEQENSLRENLIALRYSPGAQRLVADLGDPGFLADAFMLARNADADAESKKQALNFVRNSYKLTNQNLRVIHSYIVARLNAEAFDIDAATKKIASIAVPSQALLNKLKEAQGFRLLSTASRQAKGINDIDFGIVKNIATNQSVDVPYEDLIRINNEYNACMTSLTKQSE